MVVGYARVSTTDQSLSTQIEHLQSAGAEKIYQEVASGADAKRPELSAMLDFVREGDFVIVSKLDRIARSTMHLLDIVNILEQKGVPFRVLNLNLDTATATGRLMLSLLAAIATFERDLMLERQAEGIARAKKEGVYKGRVPVARKRSSEVLELASKGWSKKDIALRLGISRASVYRIIADAGQFPKQPNSP